MHKCYDMIGYRILFFLSGHGCRNLEAAGGPDIEPSHDVFAAILTIQAALQLPVVVLSCRKRTRFFATISQSLATSWVSHPP